MKKLTIWQRLLFILSIYVVVELYISSIVTYTPEIKKWSTILDTIICGLFLYDFFHGLIVAKRKWRFISLNWIDFVSSIPMVGVLRVGRVVKVFRVLRVMRSGKYLYSLFSRNNSVNALKNLALIITFLIIVFSLSVFQLEKGINPYFDSIGNSIWWTIHTTITFGFLQDIAPVSLEGKFISLVLILMGMILFGTFISTITDYFVEEEDIKEDVAQLKKMVGELSAKIEKLDESISKKL
jgi:voltage-gated potassium channel